MNITDEQLKKMADNYRAHLKYSEANPESWYAKGKIKAYQEVYFILMENDPNYSLFSEKP